MENNIEVKTVTYRVWGEWMGWFATVWVTETEEKFLEWAEKWNFKKEEDGIWRGKPNNKGNKGYVEFKD